VEKSTANGTSPYRQIYIVFGVLVVLTVIEFIIAVADLALLGGVFLLLIALAKAGLIVQFFMHIYRLWRDEESH
jgi:caa(3)-type oxidase subunit IV